MNNEEIDALKLIISKFKVGVEIDKRHIIQLLEQEKYDKPEDIFLSLRRSRKLKHYYLQFYILSKSALSVLEPKEIKPVVKRRYNCERRSYCKSYTPRKCLKCGKMFPSSHIGNRLCYMCSLYIKTLG